jgi:DNA-directed RNA polymerase subunit L
MSKIDANIIIKEKQNSIDGFNNNYILFQIKGKDINYIICNTIRRTILTLVPSYAFDPDNIIIEKNTSVYNNDYMRLRLSNMPIINQTYKKDKMIIKNDDSILEEVLELEIEANTSNFENKNILTKEEEEKKKEYRTKLLNNLNLNISAKNESSSIMSITTDNIKFSINNKDIKSIYPNPILIIKLKPEQPLVHIQGEEFRATCIASLNIPLKNAIYSSCNICSYDEIDTNTFEFKLSSMRQISEETIVIHACKIIIIKLEKLKEKIINAIKLQNNEQALIEAKLIISNENHTLGNLLTRIIQEHPDIIFCGYNIDHLYVNELTLRYKTNGKNIIDIIDKSINYLISLYKHLILQIEKLL